MVDMTLNRRIWTLSVALAFAGMMPLAVCAQAQDDAHSIFNLTNQDRKAQGLQPLEWNAALAAAAQAHAVRMAQQQQLSHQYPGEPALMQRAVAAGAHFQAIAENVAMAPDADGVENAWMHSTPHRTNILDPKMNALGVGVVERGGNLWAVEDFAQASETLGPQQVEQKVGALLQALHVDPSGPASEAEQACTIEKGLPPGSKARSVVRFETPDLSQLPNGLAASIGNGQFKQAAVGACAPLRNNPAFTTYRVAILLY